MSYEFNPQTPNLELPNPYRLENAGLFLCAAVALVCTVPALLSLRAHLTQQLAQHSVSASLAGASVLTVALIALGFSWVAGAAGQLRFYFGRNRPHSLAPEMANGATGSSVQAEHLQDSLRHSALAVSEPWGALAGILYNVLPNLIFAPAEVRRAAQRQFQNMVGLTALLLSYLLTWGTVGASGGCAWVGLVYCLVGMLCLRFPDWGRGGTSENGLDIALIHRAEPGMLAIWALLSAIGPIIFVMLVPHLNAWDDTAVNGVVLIAMLLLLCSCFVHLIALYRQLAPAPQEVGAARSTRTVTMNAHPSKLMEELDRLLTRDWYERIPNRRYSHHGPKLEKGQGAFSAQRLEEVQPRPKPTGVVQSVRHALEEPYFKWLAALSLLSTACLSGCCIALSVAITDLLASPAVGVSHPLALALCLGVVGSFSRYNAHQLWSRFDFLSELIWVEIAGSYESANLRVGNQITGQLQSEKKVINVEAMTLRVWVAELESVIFGKDAPRQVIRMRALPERAEQIAQELQTFAEARSMVVAPTSELDMKRLHNMGKAQQFLGDGLQQNLGKTAEGLAKAALSRLATESGGHADA